MGSFIGILLLPYSIVLPGHVRSVSSVGSLIELYIPSYFIIDPGFLQFSMIGSICLHTVLNPLRHTVQYVRHNSFHRTVPPISCM